MGRGKLEIDALDQNGRTPLHYAAALDFVKTMKLLINRGADISRIDRYQAKNFYPSFNSVACTEYTIGENASLVTSQDYVCRTALHYAPLIEELKIAVKDALTSAGIRGGIIDIHGKTALQYEQMPYDTTDAHFEVVQWIDRMYLKGYTTVSLVINHDLDNSYYYHQRYGGVWTANLDYTMARQPKEEKTWTIVSDSDEEDFDLSTTMG
ncbi:MAG: hypothetical protein L6R41_005198 [Letrouitia leprolyta]|nr:MAG: hypothetical protein L6R41_005198 [Letrouitia leprolyta]